MNYIPNNKGRSVSKVGALSLAQLVLHLLDGTMTLPELAEATGLHYQTVRAHCGAMHKARAVHIITWEQDARGRDALRVYKMGPGKDAPRRKLSARDRQRAYRSKMAGVAVTHALAGAMQ